MNKISNSKSSSLNELQQGIRTVLYEEMAEYFYLFARRSALKEGSIGSEVNYHIGNLVLLSFYFDIILVQTATIFNVSDPFVQKVIDNIILHKKFREMLDSDKLKIVGWGGNTPKEMFSAADGFSRNASPNSKSSNNRSSIISTLFNPDRVVTRAEGLPDAKMEVLFKKRLEQTTIIRSPSNMLALDRVLQESMEKTGQLVAVSFNPELRKLELSSSDESAVGLSFIQSWHDHLSCEIPGVITYAPMTNHLFSEQEMIISERTIKTFLYSPQIFASFLGRYIRSKDFNKILRQPFQKLEAVKNGDWKRFADAYHEAIVNVSESIGHLEYSNFSTQDFSNQVKWAANISDAIINNPDKVDVNAFIESLAMLSGAIFAIPFLSPAFKFSGVLIGKRMNNRFHVFKQHATTEVSPFIQKLLKHYGLEGVRA